MVIPQEWMKTYQPDIHWGHNRVTFKSKYCQEHDCSITLALEQDPMDKIYSIRLTSLTRGTAGQDTTHTRQTTVLPNMIIHSQLSTRREYEDFDDVLSNESAEQVRQHTKRDNEIPIHDEKQPPWGPINPLSPPEQRALREYLVKIIARRRIRPSTSPCRGTYPLSTLEVRQPETLC